MRIAKLLIFFSIFSALYYFAKNLLILLGMIRISNVNGLLFSAATLFLLAFLYKHKYWIIACLFMAVSEFIKIFVQESFTTESGTFNKPDATSIAIMLGAMFFVSVSFICLLKFLRIKQYEDYYLFKGKKQ